MVVACVLKTGGAYTSEHVRVLHAMVGRHLDFERFVCLTDSPFLVLGVESIPLKHKWPGWWSKLELHSDRVAPKGTRILYLDLDSVITGDLSAIASRPEDFIVVADVYRRPPKAKRMGYQSSVMLWTAGALAHVYQDFLKDAAGIMRRHAKIGDQAWLETAIPRAAFWEDTNPGEVVSFKRDCRAGPPNNARIVDFHGKQTKPWTATAPWVKEHYRLETVC